MAEIRPVNVNGYPLDGDSRILKQGKTDYVAVGQEEIDKLPTAQKKAVEKLSAKQPLVGFVSVDDGTLLFTQGDAPIVATVDKKGKTKKLVDWL